MIGQLINVTRFTIVVVDGGCYLCLMTLDSCYLATWAIDCLWGDSSYPLIDSTVSITSH